MTLFPAEIQTRLMAFLIKKHDAAVNQGLQQYRAVQPDGTTAPQLAVLHQQRNESQSVIHRPFQNSRQIMKSGNRWAFTKLFFLLEAQVSIASSLQRGRNKQRNKIRRRKEMLRRQAQALQSEVMTEVNHEKQICVMCQEAVAEARQCNN
jgi:hypothetical protein